MKTPEELQRNLVAMPERGEMYKKLLSEPGLNSLLFRMIHSDYECEVGTTLEQNSGAIPQGTHSLITGTVATLECTAHKIKSAPFIDKKSGDYRK